MGKVSIIIACGPEAQEAAETEADADAGTGTMQEGEGAEAEAEAEEGVLEEYEPRFEAEYWDNGLGLWKGDEKGTTTAEEGGDGTGAGANLRIFFK
jgi:hypothetical protein